MSTRRIPRWVWRYTWFVGMMSFILVTSIVSGDSDGIIVVASFIGVWAIQSLYRYLIAKPADPLPPALMAWLDEQSRGTVEAPAVAATYLSDYD